MPRSLFIRRKGDLEGDYMRALRGSREAGRTAEDEYLRRTLEYDPQEALNRSTEAAYGAIREQLDEDIARFRGQQVGAGRLDTGFRFEGEDLLVRDAFDRLNRELARNALTTENLRMRATESLGAFGERTTGRYLDLLTGGLDRAAAEEAAEEERRRRRRSGIGGLLGAGVGFLAGGPMGAAVGARLGSWASDIF
jgi:hypothetical protein